VSGPEPPPAANDSKACAPRMPARAWHQPAAGSLRTRLQRARTNNREQQPSRILA
jgi:hypothetical protein